MLAPIFIDSPKQVLFLISFASFSFLFLYVLILIFFVYFINNLFYAELLKFQTSNQV